MGAHSELKEMYDDIAAAYFKKKGYEIITKYGQGGPKPDVLAKKGATIAFVEVKSPKETSCGKNWIYKKAEKQYLGGIPRKDLWKRLSDLLNQGPKPSSLLKLYIATITHEMYHAYLKNPATNDPNRTVEIYLCTPIDNEHLPNKYKKLWEKQYKAATDWTLDILEKLKLITVVSTDKYCDDVYCIGIYQFCFHDMPKEETEENIKKLLNEAKKSKLPESIVPLPSPSPSRPFPPIPIEPKSLGIIAAVILAIILVWWLFSHFLWTNDKATSFNKKEEAAPISMSTPIPEPTAIPKPATIPTPDPVYFQFNKYDINDEATAQIISLAEQIKKSYTNFTVSVDSYTCNIGSPSYNLKLSENRANAVKSILLAIGIPSSSVRVMPRGIAPNNNETKEGRIKNRRADISVSMPDKD